MKSWDPIQLAKQAIIRLNDQGTYYTPIFREKEIEEIESFLVKGITDQKSTSTLCICQLNQMFLGYQEQEKL